MFAGYEIFCLHTYPGPECLRGDIAGNTNSLLGKAISPDRILQHAQTLNEELLSNRGVSFVLFRGARFVTEVP